MMHIPLHFVNHMTGVCAKTMGAIIINHSDGMDKATEPQVLATGTSVDR